LRLKYHVIILFQAFIEIAVALFVPVAYKLNTSFQLAKLIKFLLLCKLLGVFPLERTEKNIYVKNFSVRAGVFQKKVVPLPPQTLPQ
jgi:hypothetical protein